MLPCSYRIALHLATRYHIVSQRASRSHIRVSHMIMTRNAIDSHMVAFDMRVISILHCNLRCSQVQYVQTFYCASHLDPRPGAIDRAIYYLPHLSNFAHSQTYGPFPGGKATNAEA